MKTTPGGCADQACTMKTSLNGPIRDMEVAYTMNINTMKIRRNRPIRVVIPEAMQMSPEVIVSVVFGVIASLLAVAGVIATLHRQRRRPDVERVAHSEALYPVVLRDEVLNQMDLDFPRYIKRQTFQFARFESIGYLDGRTPWSHPVALAQWEPEYERGH
ncbi:hypothetical protein PG991_016256 [Apiospora marii]|uniref:Uncharacterized protein n=1 Tax=Apiospora marii TaxID=335849 RepID=A0ABR1QZR5_9PEZI